MQNSMFSLSSIIKSILVVGISVFIVSGVVRAGSLTPSSSPAATSYTLSDIYNRLVTNATATSTNHDFSPGASPAATLYSLSQIYSAIPTIVANTVLTGTSYLGVTGTAQVATGNALAAQVLSTYTFSNSSSISLTGTMTNNGAVTITPSSSSQSIAAGYHNGSGTVAGDTDLIAANIASGTNIFGVTGTARVATGTAAAAQVLTGYTFSNSTSISISGSMADNGAVTITPSTNSQAIAAGYHNGSGTVAGDADLIAANIASGTNIFGVTGTLSFASSATGNAAAAQVLTGYTFSNSTSISISGSMADNGAVTITPSTSAQTIAAGYHNGSGTVLGDSDFIAANFLQTVNIFGVTGTLFTNQFNGNTTTVLGAVTSSGGIDDFDAGGAPTPGRYATNWTQCVAGNNYCGTGLTSADARDDVANLIWSLPCNGARCSSFSDSVPLTYAWDATTTNDASGGVTSTASGLCIGGATGGLHGQTGWYLPHQRQMMQAYVDGSYGQLEATGTQRAYWSNTLGSTNTSTQSWSVNLAVGTVAAQSKAGATLNYVRCVRAAP